ncbi:MAG: DUF4286 family protein [Bacteroidales bacterium]|nr:DUF4286 family protein [Bacteroidales bacterium]MDE6237298.1 DUF4286 family protein [Muribaculaceae bacterium]MDE6536479.1 DUF4286 family protein [Muribaculaceae bacterium]MDE6836312.1 DUF4286 family protein [Muribaculaceae bacterium]
MTIHNATFMVRKEQEADVILWLKGEKIDLANGCNPRVSAMREAGGIRHDQADAASIAYQVEFPDEKSAKDWSNGPFSELANKFDGKFGPEGMVFTSLFEVV